MASSAADNRPAFAVVGLGRAGSFHITSLSELAQLVRLKYVVDVVEEVAQRVAKAYGAIPLTDLEEALKDDDLRAVVIASTTHAHPQQIISSLARGKAVFTEKPISFDPKELAFVIDRAVESKVPFFVGFQRRCDANFKAARDMIRAGKVGGVRMVRSSSRDNPEPPLAYLKISGGIFHDMLCHDFDMLHFLTGEVPSSVYSVAHTYNPAIAAMDDCDTVIVTLKYDSGILATVDTSRISAYGYDQRIEVFGEGGMIQVENQRDHTVTCATREGYTSAVSNHSFPQRYAKTYKDEMVEFVQMVLEWRTEPEEVTRRHVVLERVATAAELSWKEGRPITLAELDERRRKEAEGGAAAGHA